MLAIEDEVDQSEDMYCIPAVGAFIVVIPSFLIDLLGPFCLSPFLSDSAKKRL